ncbi:MAG: TetR/AcrR family transcriptional regulator [Thermoleophilia bacterium]
MEASTHSVHTGRPRDDSVDARVLAVALDLLGSAGFSEMTMDEVARRSGVGKTTIYRRWASKEELAIAALNASKPAQAIPDLGDTRAELVRLVQMRLATRLSAEARLSPRIFDDAVSRPELKRLLWDRLVAPRRQQMQQFLRRGIARGDLRPDLDLDVAPDVIIGALTSAARTAVLTEQGFTDSAALAERLVDSLWRGLGASKTTFETEE